MLDRWGVYLPPIYICIVLDLAIKHDFVYWYARHLCSIDGGSICLLYICIVLDLAIKLIWCTGMQGIYA